MCAEIFALTADETPRTQIAPSTVVSHVQVSRVRRKHVLRVGILGADSVRGPDAARLNISGSRLCLLVGLCLLVAVSLHVFPAMSSELAPLDMAAPPPSPAVRAREPRDRGTWIVRFGLNISPLFVISCVHGGAPPFWQGHFICA